MENRIVFDDTLKQMIETYQLVFDVVRLVDVTKRREITFNQDGTYQVKEGFCHSVWKKDKRCLNCISARTYSDHKDTTKFEFIDNEIFFVMAKYMKIGETECVLELVKHVEDTTLIGAYGQNQFVEKITDYNQKMYKDSLTQIRNRRYFDEQLLGLPITALAVIDIDYFKSINDTYGHTMGDMALVATARCIERCIKDEDLLIRYGGDEFVVAFESISKEVFEKILHRLNTKVSEMANPTQKDMQITLSIGGVYGKGKTAEMFKQADEALYEAKLLRNTAVIKDLK